jgi:hypothetical protein
MYLLPVHGAKPKSTGMTVYASRMAFHQTALRAEFLFPQGVKTLYGADDEGLSE